MIGLYAYVFGPLWACADESSLNLNLNEGTTAMVMPAAESYDDASEILRFLPQFAQGFAAGYLVHELGHAGSAAMLGHKVKIYPTGLGYPGLEDDRDQFRIISSGFQAQWIASEVSFGYLQDPLLRPEQAKFHQGVVMFHLLTTAAYATVLYRHHDGDIAGMSRHSGAKKEHVLAAVALPALVDALRLYGGDAPWYLQYLSITFKGLAAGYVWAF